VHRESCLHVHLTTPTTRSQGQPAGEIVLPQVALVSSFKFSSNTLLSLPPRRQFCLLCQYPPTEQQLTTPHIMALTTILTYIFIGFPVAVFFATQILYVVASLTKTPHLDFYARCAASFTALFVCATYGTLASALLNVVGYGGLGQWTTARAFKWSMLLYTGVWMESE
jgi:hypothetical protein